MFDLDNTLIKIENSHNHFDNIIIEVFKKALIEVPSQDQRDLLWRNNDYKTLLSGWNFQDYRLFWKLFDEIDYIERKKLYEKGYIKMYNDVIPLLKTLKSKNNIYLALITNTTERIAEFELRAFGIYDQFDELCALGDNQESCKPSPDGIYNILSGISEEFHTLKENTYIIGDSRDDVSAGQNAGIKTIYVNRKNKSPEQITFNPDYIINSLDVIPEIIGI